MNKGNINDSIKPIKILSLQSESPLAVMTLDNDGIIIETNRALTNILGFEKTKLKGIIVNTIISEKDCDLFYFQHMANRESLFKQISKVEFRKKNGTITNVLVESVCRYIDRNKRQYRCILTEIKKSMPIDSLIKYKRGKFLKLFGFCHDPYVLLSIEDKKILQVTDNFRKFTGYTESDIHGKEIVDLCHSDDKIRLAEFLSSEDNYNGYNNLSFKIIGKKKEVHEVSLSLYVTKDISNKAMALNTRWEFMKSFMTDSSSSISSELTPVEYLNDYNNNIHEIITAVELMKLQKDLPDVKKTPFIEKIIYNSLSTNEFLNNPYLFDKKRINQKTKIKTILFVDDEAINLRNSKELLTHYGYKVLLAENGERAIEIYKEKKKEIDLVILDMYMPDMSGDKVFYSLKEINKFCKVIIASGLEDQRILSKMHNDGLMGFISKPYTIEQLDSLLKRIQN